MLQSSVAAAVGDVVLVAGGPDDPEVVVDAGCGVCEPQALRTKAATTRRSVSYVLTTGCRSDAACDTPMAKETPLGLMPGALRPWP